MSSEIMPPPLSLRGIFNSLRVPTARDLLFSVKAYLAAAMCLVVGFSQDLPNPYWAVLTVYIVLTPPESAAIRSKAWFRLFGTVTGGLVAIAITSLFGDQLGILLASIILLMVGAAYMRQIDRTPFNFFWFAFAVTVAVVGLINLLQPMEIFLLAVARMTEILLGIAAITALDSMIAPRPMTPAFLDDMADWRKTALHRLRDVLDDVAAHLSESERRQQAHEHLRELTKGLDLIDAKAVQLPFDIVRAAPRRAALNLLRRQVAALIADLAGIEAWTRALRRTDGPSPPLDAVLAATSRWTVACDKNPATIDHAMNQDLLEQLRTLRSISRGWEGATPIGCGLAGRLMSFVDNWADLTAALSSVETGRRLPPCLEQRARKAQPVRSIDYHAAALEVAPMLLAMSFAAALWYLSAWPTGASAVLFSFIGCVFFLGQNQILRSAGGLLCCVLTGFGLVFTYQFAVLPRVTELPVLLLVFAVALIPAGLLMAMSMSGMLICVYMFAFLGLQNVYSGDFQQSINTLAACVTGLFIATSALHICSFDHAAFRKRRLTDAIRRDIRDLARSRHLPGRDRLLLLTLDRLALYFTVADSAEGDAFPEQLFDDLRFGYYLLRLREIEPQLGPEDRASVGRLRAATLAGSRFTRGQSADPDRLLAVVEDALTHGHAEHKPPHAAAQEALIGIRIALTGHASPVPRRLSTDAA